MGMECMVSAIKPADVARYLADPEGVETFFSGNRKGMFVSLEKAWHGLHYLLTGSAMEGEMPLAFILQGGEAIGEDLGYGPPRLFQHSEVGELDAALAAVSDDELWRRFNPEQMSAEGVYPEIWEEPEGDLRDEYVTYFREMKGLIKKANAEKCALLVVLT